MSVPSLALGQALVESEIEKEMVPDAAIASAVKAVDELGKAVVRGHYQTAFQQMNPKEKKLLARKEGGIEALEEKLKTVPARMKEQGVRILSFKPQGKPEAYAVEPVFIKPAEGGGNTEAGEVGERKGRWVYSQWLVLVPTVTRFEVSAPGEDQADKKVIIESQSFQVAVSDRDKEEWTFIDGAGLTVGRLRQHYSVLPAKMELPKVQKRQIQN